MDDLISRQAAIEAANEAADDWDGGWSPSRYKMIEDAINALPSAEPQIVRCMNCAHNIGEKYGTGEEAYCAVHDFKPPFNAWYCADGERRADDD